MHDPGICPVTHKTAPFFASSVAAMREPSGRAARSCAARQGVQFCKTPSTRHTLQRGGGDLPTGVSTGPTLARYGELGA